MVILPHAAHLLAKGGPQKQEPLGESGAGLDIRLDPVQQGGGNGRGGLGHGLPEAGHSQRALVHRLGQ